MTKRQFKRILIKARNWLFVKDLFNVALWFAILFIAINFVGAILGPDNFATISFTFIQKALAGLCAFAIILLGSWVMLKLFFPIVTIYFEDPDGPGDNLKSEFHNDLCRIIGPRHSQNTPLKCYVRPLFFLFVYFFVLALVVAVTIAML